MSWQAKHPDDHSEPLPADPHRAKLYDELRESSLPVISRDQGQKPLLPIVFQTIIGRGIYEGEFASKDNDIIFHFWPFGYHTAERMEKRTPTFPVSFKSAIERVFQNTFGGANRLKITDDADIGAVTVQALGWGTSSYARDLSIKACKSLYTALGGEDS